MPGVPGSTASYGPGALRPLPRRFFNRDPRQVAPELLGKVLVRREGKTLLAGRIVELEVYLGENDPAAHAFAGRTARNFVLFGPPGRAYVYFIYGNHYCLNVSCMPEGQAGSLLFRALEPLTGQQQMACNRGISAESVRGSKARLLTSGPGRLAEAFAITRMRDNGKDMVSPDSDLMIVDDGYRPAKVSVTPRIGITKAAGEPLRYIIQGNVFVSKTFSPQRASRTRRKVRETG
ncbi:MAG: DNA-3-methyladenine glycosylase [Terriglobales bacterium]